MRANKFLCLLILPSFFLFGCGLTSNRTEVVKKSDGETVSNPVTATGKAAVAMDSDLVSTIEFKPGRKGLSPEATAEINEALMQAKQRGQVALVNIAVWSDSEYPAGQGQAVPKTQVELAKERGENIQKYIDRMEPDAKIRVHNMAEQPSTFSKFLKTQDVKVKDQLAAAGVVADETSEQVKGRSSSAVVFIEIQ